MSEIYYKAVIDCINSVDGLTASVNTNPETKVTTLRVGDKKGRACYSQCINRPHIRPTFEQVYMNFAESIAARSTCQRLHVGTVITTLDYRKVLSVGYNGNASGLKNCCDRDESGNCGCLHSEDNAIINCEAPRNIDKVVFITHLPCVMCAKRIVNLGGVWKVIFKNDYRNRDSVALLNYCGIPLFQLSNNILTRVHE